MVVSRVGCRWRGTARRLWWTAAVSLLLLTVLPADGAASIHHPVAVSPAAHTFGGGLFGVGAPGGAASPTPTPADGEEAPAETEGPPTVASATPTAAGDAPVHGSSELPHLVGGSPAPPSPSPAATNAGGKKTFSTGLVGALDGGGGTSGGTSDGEGGGGSLRGWLAPLLGVAVASAAGMAVVSRRRAAGFQSVDPAADASGEPEAFRPPEPPPGASFSLDDGEHA